MELLLLALVVALIAIALSRFIDPGLIVVIVAIAVLVAFFINRGSL